MMLTALQAQLELGDCSETIADYRPIACHCLPARMVPTLPSDGVTMHHQSLRGMTASEAKQAFLNLIQSWPLHRATIFDVMVSFSLFLHRKLHGKVAEIASKTFAYTLRRFPDRFP